MVAERHVLAQEVTGIASRLGLIRKDKPAYPEPGPDAESEAWWRHLRDVLTGAHRNRERRAMLEADETAGTAVEALDDEHTHLLEVAARHGFEPSAAPAEKTAPAKAAAKPSAAPVEKTDTPPSPAT